MLFKVLRLNTSPYSQGLLYPLEKKALEAIKTPLHQVEYLEKAEAFNGENPLILITNTHTEPERIHRTILEGTALMLHPNSGYDNFPASFVKEAKFPIVLGNPIRKQAVVEYVLSALFTRLTLLPEVEIWDKGRSFKRSLLADKKILLMGYGHVGQKLEMILSALGARVSVYDPMIGLSRLPTSKADVVILALGLNDQTKNIVNKKFLKEQLTSDFLLINPARGELIQETDLIQTLKKQPGAYAVLDAFAPEPKDFSPYHGLKNVKLTSHIAGVWNELNQAMVQFEASLIQAFLTDVEKFFITYQASFLQKRLHQGKLL